MARKRMIDPEFWSDEEIGTWTLTARLFYIALWNFADDEGRFKAHNDLLKSQIFPYDSKIDVEKLKLELSNKVSWYEVNGLKYGHLRNFLKHQSLDRPKPSKLPAPQTIDDESTIDRRLIDPNRKEEKGKEEKRKEVLSGKPDLAAPIVYLNKKASRQFDPSNKSNQDLVKARFNEGRTFEDFTQVIDKKCSQWLTDPKMMHYLRPETLFSRSHFESYLNEPERKETSAERDARILAKFK